MSQFKWKELPDWRNAEDYAFLDGQQQEVFSWEFLRRKSEYRNDFMRIEGLKQQGENWRLSGDAKIYEPERRAGQTVEHWALWVATNFDVEPKMTPIDAFFAKKWGTQKLYDPFQPYTQGVRFLRPEDELPRVIKRPEDFDALTELVEMDDGGDVLVLAKWCVPLAFDITRSLESQLEQAEKILRQTKNQALALGRAKKSKGMNEKPDVWVRHLRVIDALRTEPKPKSSALALVLGGNAAKYAAKEQIRKQGGNFIRDALRKLQADHRNILLSGKVPTQKSP